MPVKQGRKEFTIYEDNDGQYILVTQPDASLRRLYIYSQVAPKTTPKPRDKPPVDDNGKLDFENADIKWILKAAGTRNEYEDYLARKKKNLKKAALEAQLKANRVRIFDEKLQWKGEPKVETVNRDYRPARSKVSIIDRRKLPPAIRWKAGPKVETFNRDYHPLGCFTHLLEDQPKWNSNMKVREKFVPTRVLSAENTEIVNERLKYHTKAKTLPNAGDANTAEENFGSGWLVLPKIQDKHMVTQPVNNENSEGNADMWVPQIENIIYDKKLKKWVATGFIEKPSNNNNKDENKDRGKYRKSMSKGHANHLPSIHTRSQSVTSNNTQKHNKPHHIHYTTKEPVHNDEDVFHTNRDMNYSVMSMPAHFTTSEELAVTNGAENLQQNYVQLNSDVIREESEPSIVEAARQVDEYIQSRENSLLRQL